MRIGCQSGLTRLIFLACMLTAPYSVLAARSPAVSAPPRVLAPSEDGVTAPVLTHWVDSQFSEEARKARYHGVCLVQLIVDERGLPIDVHVVRPLGMGLDNRAIEAVKRYRFEPGRYIYGGKPVRVKVAVEVPFRMN